MEPHQKQNRHLKLSLGEGNKQVQERGKTGIAETNSTLNTHGLRNQETQRPHHGVVQLLQPHKRLTDIQATQ